MGSDNKHKLQTLSCLIIGYALHFVSYMNIWLCIKKRDVNYIFLLPHITCYMDWIENCGDLFNDQNFNLLNNKLHSSMLCLWIDFIRYQWLFPIYASKLGVNRAEVFSFGFGFINNAFKSLIPNLQAAFHFAHLYTYKRMKRLLSCHP